MLQCYRHSRWKTSWTWGVLVVIAQHPNWHSPRWEATGVAKVVCLSSGIEQVAGLVNRLLTNVVLVSKIAHPHFALLLDGPVFVSPNISQMPSQGSNQRNTKEFGWKECRCVCLLLFCYFLSVCPVRATNRWTDGGWMGGWMSQCRIPDWLPGARCGGAWVKLDQPWSCENQGNVTPDSSRYIPRWLAVRGSTNCITGPGLGGSRNWSRWTTLHMPDRHGIARMVTGDLRFIQVSS